MVGSSNLDGIENWVYEDGFFDMLNILDFTMESLEGNDLGDDWIAKFDSFEPIHSDILTGSHPFSGGNNDNGNLDKQHMSSIASNETSKQSQLPKFVENTSSTSITPQNDSSDGNESSVFQATSPISVLENSSSSAAEKRMIISLDIAIPVGRRSKRSRPSTFNTWAVTSPISSSASKKIKTRGKKRNLSKISCTMEMKQRTSQQKNKKLQQEVVCAMETKGASFQRTTTRRCTHCQGTHTPQWRTGPMGPKTLCNACGVRYRSGRLFPEYRPAASPTFVPSVHSSSHRKVIEMRNKTIQQTAMTDTVPSMSQPPGFAAMSSYYFD